MANYEVVSIDEYQQRANKRYYDGLEEYRQGKRTTAPSRSMYMYLNKYGEPKRDGYVVLWPGGRSRWFKTRREAIRTVESEDKFTAPDT